MAESATAAPRQRSRFAEALRPLASRPYRLMWLGSTTSAVGDAVVDIALVFAILHIGDIGVIAAVSTVARIAFMLAGGVWADRLQRQYVMLSADAVRGAVQATLAILLLTGHAHVWELGVGAALYGAATSFFGPASVALVPETVPAAELQQANSLLGLPQSFFGIGGPAAGGVLIAIFGTGWLFAVDAASFFVSLVCLALLQVPPRPMPPPAVRIERVPGRGRQLGRRKQCSQLLPRPLVVLPGPVEDGGDRPPPRPAGQDCLFLRFSRALFMLQSPQNPYGVDVGPDAPHLARGSEVVLVAELVAA